MISSPISIFWFRRDLRLEDNHGLFHALKSGLPVLPIFIFDTSILDQLEDRSDKRLSFIYYNLERIDLKLKSFGSSILILHGNPHEIWKKLNQDYKIDQVYTNHDYEPYAIARDQEISLLLSEKGIQFNTFKDQVIFERREVMKGDGTPYTVFTPYSRVWKEKLRLNPISTYPSETLSSNFLKLNIEFPSLTSIGFNPQVEMKNDLPALDHDIIKTYHETRNFPAQIKSTTRLSVHLRFGTISVRHLVLQALKINETWLNELIWREFFMQIMFHFPKVIGSSFKSKYDSIQWRNDEEEFKKWCEGRTGFPIVDAGMRELNQTGFMHNRVRMIVASFLTKDLLIDWRWGEAYFAQKLLDFELAINNGNWQWAAGTGCDAAPYFRIFNPAEQTKKFDSKSEYINKWLSPNDLMILPIVDHSLARLRALEVYKVGLNKFQS